MSRGITKLYNHYPHLHYNNFGGFGVSHLAFADDLIIFSNVSLSSMSKISNFLFKFEQESGLRINKCKSTFIHAKNMPYGTIRAITNEIGFLLNVYLLPTWELLYILGGRNQ